MSGFRTLSMLVREALERLPRMPGEEPGDIREAATLLAVGTWGASWVQRQPAMVNAAALALRMAGRLELTDVRPGAARLVAETDLHSLPAEPPRLLRAPAVLLEVRHPDRERLTGDCVSLGAYQHEGGWYLLGLDWPAGIWGGLWRPEWTGGELAAGVRLETHSLIEVQPGRHYELIAAAARMLVVLGVLLDAEGAPMREERERAESRRSSAAAQAGMGGWTTRRLYLDDRRAGGAGGSGGGGAADLSDRAEQDVPVRGHLKRQPHGPGGTLRRWIWVEGYEARRWIGPKPRRTVVQ